MKRTTITISIIFLLLLGCRPPIDKRLEHHFLHWKEDTEEKDLLIFKRNPFGFLSEKQDSLFFINSRIKCDSACQMNIIHYFEDNNQLRSRGSEFFFTYMAFHAWLNNEEIDKDKLMLKTKLLIINLDKSVCY